jgi:transposase-like protein
LLKQYEARLDKLLEAIDPQAELHLTEIEEAALELRQRTGEDVTQALAERQTRITTPDVACPDCGTPLRYKGKKRKHLRSRSGEIVVQRAYYSCPACRRGHFPPG